MSELKLLPCPFCGGVAVMNQDDEGYYVSCSGEGCVVMTNSYTEEKASEVWNTRTPVDKVIERLETEGKLADEERDRCARENPLHFDTAKGYATGIYNAIEIIKEEVGYSE